MKFEFFNRTFYFFANEEQRYKFVNFLKSYLFGKPAAFLAFGICILILFMLIIALFCKEKKRHVLNILMAIMYIVVLILIFLCNRDGGVRQFSIATMSDYVLQDGYHESKIILAGLYILTFIPLGFLLRKAMGKKWKILRFALIIFISVGIEVAQYIFSRGVTSMVDMVMYIIGAYIGIFIMSIFGLIDDAFKHLFRKDKKEKTQANNSEG